MSTTTPTDKKRTARVRDTYIPLGRDSADVHHVYRTTDETVISVDPDAGRRTAIYDVSGRSVDDFMAFIAEYREWTRRAYGVGIVELAARGLEG